MKRKIFKLFFVIFLFFICVCPIQHQHDEHCNYDPITDTCDHQCVELYDQGRGGNAN